MASKWNLFRVEPAKVKPLSVAEAHAELLKKSLVYLKHLEDEVQREYNKTEWAKENPSPKKGLYNTHLPYQNGGYLKDRYPKLASAIDKQLLVANLMDALNGKSRNKLDSNYDHIHKYLPSKDVRPKAVEEADMIKNITQAKGLIDTYGKIGTIKKHRDPTLGDFINAIRKFFYSILEKISPGVLEEFTPLENVSFTKSKGEKFVEEFNAIEPDSKKSPIL